MLSGRERATAYTTCHRPRASRQRFAELSGHLFLITTRSGRTVVVPAGSLDGFANHLGHRHAIFWQSRAIGRVLKSEIPKNFRRIPTWWKVMPLKTRSKTDARKRRLRSLLAPFTER